MPGQYYQSETGLNYNYNRDYDPLAGSYIQSDPAGLAAGVSTYAYVGADPTAYVDPFGLDRTIVINTTGGRHIWDGPTNGNWGGGCWSGGQYSCGGHPMGKAPPTDSGDMCYMHHDLCWAHCGGNKVCIAACNNTLVQELLALPIDPKQWPMPPPKGTEPDSASFRSMAVLSFMNDAAGPPLVPGIPNTLVK